MPKIYRLSDRIPVKFGDIVIKFGILTKHQRTEINSATMIENGERVVDVNLATWLSLKYSIKGIEGVTYATGGEFEVEFEDDKTCLSDACVEEILTLEIRDNLYLAATQMVNGVPDKIIHPLTRKELKGVKVLPVEGVSKKGN